MHGWMRAIKPTDNIVVYPDIHWGLEDAPRWSDFAYRVMVPRRGGSIAAVQASRLGHTRTHERFIAYLVWSSPAKARNCSWLRPRTHHGKPGQGRQNRQNLAARTQRQRGRCDGGAKYHVFSSHPGAVSRHYNPTADRAKRCECLANSQSKVMQRKTVAPR